MELFWISICFKAKSIRNGKKSQFWVVAFLCVDFAVVNCVASNRFLSAVANFCLDMIILGFVCLLTKFLDKFCSFDILFSGKESF